jgi:prophage regulatory protein
MPSPLTTSPAVAPSPFRGRQLRQHRPQISAETSAEAELAALAGSAQCERLLRLRDVVHIVGMSRAHVYNLIKQGLFPRPIALGSNCARWVQSEVQAWVSDSIATARLTPAGRAGRTSSR